MWTDTPRMAHCVLALHLRGSARAKEPNARQAEDTSSHDGEKSHAWCALAIAVTAAARNGGCTDYQSAGEHIAGKLEIAETQGHSFALPTAAGEVAAFRCSSVALGGRNER